MKYLIIISLASCTNDNAINNKIKLTKDVESSKSIKTEVLSTHIVELQCNASYLPLRNRIPTKKELALSQQGTQEANVLNEELIVGKLYNGQFIRLLKADTLGYHYVQVIDQINNTELQNQTHRRGFIIANYCNKPTLRKIETINLLSFKQTDETKSIIDFLDNYKYSNDLLDYAFAFISDEADLIQTLSFRKSGINSITYKISVITLQKDLLLFTGSAEISDKYHSRKGEIFSRYIATPFMGHDFEIHIKEDGSIAFLRFNEPKELQNYSKPEEEIMDRIK
jgi:hypothetical protein